MLIKNIKFTPNALKLIGFSDEIARNSGFKGIHPIHLFLGSLEMDCDAYKETKSLISLDSKEIEALINLEYDDEHIGKLFQISGNGEKAINILPLTREIIFEAKRIAEMCEEHGQIFVNDGQLLKAIFNSEDVLIKKCLENLNKELILSIISNPRDMIVYLDNEFEIINIQDIVIKKVTKKDKNKIRKFVVDNFYERWANTVDYGLSLENIPIYMALDGEKVIGFAGYNISKQRKGYFGPLGVLKSYRLMGIGKVLVRSCLNDMRNLGFNTCIIGNGSSIEFYEKACGAKDVPIKLN